MTHEQAQFLTTFLTGLWEGEFPATCKVLAAVPDAGHGYRPDDKSRTARELAVHLVMSDLWFLDAVKAGSFGWDAEAEKSLSSACPTSASLVERYTAEFPKKLAEVRAMSGDDMTRTTDFFGMMKGPSVTFLGFGNNHSMHHRGQLASYLRAMGSKVPAIYGGSADEPMQS
ncbi:MAG: DinB family protein [Vicinamibacterales bacterium]